MKKIVVIGAGKIGSTITQLLSRSGDYEVVVADRSASSSPTSKRIRRSRLPKSTSPTAMRCARCWPGILPC